MLMPNEDFGKILMKESNLDLIDINTFFEALPKHKSHT